MAAASGGVSDRRHEASPEGMETPCVNVCSIEPATRLCAGCGRSIDEIAAWAALGNDERRRIMNELPRRIGRHGGGSR